jgi:hypothetical protein
VRASGTIAAVVEHGPHTVHWILLLVLLAAVLL